MKLKGKRMMDKKEAGELLARLGEELKAGRLGVPAFAGKALDLRVKEPIEVEVEYKEKRRRSKFEVELKWSRRGAQGAPERPLEGKAKIKTRKAVKKEMKAVLYEVEKAAAGGGLASASASFKRFQELNRRFNNLAEGEWSRDMKAQNKLIEELGRALAREDAAAAGRLVDRIWKLKKACHGKYKEY